MEIRQKLPEDVNSIDVGLGQRETIPSHILTAHQEVGGVLEGNVNGKKGVTLVSQSLSGEKAVALSWNGVDCKLSEEEIESLSGRMENYLKHEFDVEEVDVVSTNESEDYLDVQNIMGDAWGSTGMGEAELIPTYEFEAKDNGGNLIVTESEGISSLAYMFPDLKKDNVLYSHAVGSEKQASGAGFDIKKKQREKASEHDYKSINWTVDPLKPVNNRLNMTKLGGKAVEYKEDVYDTETSGGTPADRFVIEWNIESERVENKLNNKEVEEKGYLRDIGLEETDIVLSVEDGLPQNLIPEIDEIETIYCKGENSDQALGVEIPEDPVEDMNDKVEEEWRYTSRKVLSSLMSHGYQVTELMRPGENGFRQNTYILEN